ncbi:transcriptional regulator [Bradyrhizobium sp. USDA 336]|uniref:transcriptional regulator n=1 Tax=Bradyrhizobium sp. USDA 336 TaxID=3156311 RepID=UPI003833E4EF
MKDAPEQRYVFAVGTSGNLDSYLQDYVDLLEEINKESARGGVLTAASFIDDLLQKSISAFLVDEASAKKLCQGFNAPIGTLSAKIAVAYGLGLISSDERAECDTIRAIRNKFAHTVRVSFMDHGVANLCSKLKFASDEPGINSHMKFTSAAVTLVARLVNRPKFVAKEKRETKEWPTATEKRTVIR